MGLLCRYEPGLPMPEAERLAARLDHSPEALTHVGQRLSRKLSARQVLDMSHAELLELLRRGGICSPTERIRAAVEALAPEWRFAQDLLRALAMEAEARRLGVRARLTLADSYAVARILGIYDPAAALRKAEEAEHQQAKWLGERHRETLRTGSLIARLQLRCRLPDTAADQARSVWRAQCNVLGESDHETLETLHLLGEALEATGHSARAALTCYREKTSPNSSRRGSPGHSGIDEFLLPRESKPHSLRQLTIGGTHGRHFWTTALWRCERSQRSWLPPGHGACTQVKWESMRCWRTHEAFLTVSQGSVERCQGDPCK